MSSVQHKRLTKFVKRLLGFAWVLFVAVAIVWPIVAVGVGSNFFYDSDLRYIEIFLGFKIFPDLTSGATTELVGAARELVHGHSKVQLNTPSTFAWVLFVAMTEVSLFIFLYGLAQMRALFSSLLDDTSFTQENAVRIKKVGLILIGWHIVIPLMQYFGGRAILNDIDLNVQGIQLYPAFEINIAGLSAGLAVIVLSGILREAANIHREQSLTI